MGSRQEEGEKEVEEEDKSERWSYWEAYRRPVPRGPRKNFLPVEVR